MAVSISTLAACFWAFWGSNENFHEGWFSPNLWKNIALMIAQYLSPMLVIVAISVLTVYWPRLALPIFGSVASLTVWFFRAKPVATLMIALPLLALAVLYHFGRPAPRAWALRCVIGLPLATAVICGAYPGWLATHRLDDGNYGVRLIQGNGVALVWAPEGPGWPIHGSSWQQARKSCGHLTADAHSLADTPQNLWRLPTVDEAVRSLVFRGRNAGGTWDADLQQPHYSTTPDKDSPLWKVHSQVIYWWTATEINEREAYYIAYNGFVLRTPKQMSADYLAFRCVSESPPSTLR